MTGGMTEVEVGDAMIGGTREEAEMTEKLSHEVAGMTCETHEAVEMTHGVV